MNYCYLLIKNQQSKHIKCDKSVAFRGVTTMSGYVDISEICRRAPRSSDYNDNSISWAVTF